MSEEDKPAPGSGPSDADQVPTLSEAEIEALEQQMREIRVEDLLVQTVASVLNLSARRILKEDEVDLAQARLGIDAVRALIDLLPAEAQASVREPLSQIQLLFAQRSGGDASADDAGGKPSADGHRGGADGSGPTEKPGGASGLWVPGGPG